MIPCNEVLQYLLAVGTKNTHAALIVEFGRGVDTTLSHLVELGMIFSYRRWEGYRNTQALAFKVCKRWEWR